MVQYDIVLIQCCYHSEDHPTVILPTVVLVGTHDCLGVPCVERTPVSYSVYLT